MNIEIIHFSLHIINFKIPVSKNVIEVASVLLGKTVFFFPCSKATNGEIQIKLIQFKAAECWLSTAEKDY